MSSQYSSRFRSRSSLTSCQHVCGRLYCCRPGCKASIKNRQNYCGLESFALASTVRTNTDSPLFCPKKDLDQLKSSRRHINKNPYHTTNNESLLLDLKENPTGNQQLDNVSCTLASNRLVLFGTLHLKRFIGVEKDPPAPLPCICRPESSQRASTCGCWCRSPSFRPRCPRSNGSGSWYTQFWPKKRQYTHNLIFATKISVSHILGFHLII